MTNHYSKMELNDLSPTREVREETCALSSVRRVAAMLDLDPAELVTGQPLPRGWQFFLMAADTRRRNLRSDGFPGLGVPMPDLGLPRLMLGGRTVVFHRDIPIGADLERLSVVQNVSQKSTSSGEIAVVTVAHELHLGHQGGLAIMETQTYLLLPARNPLAGASVQATRLKPKAEFEKIVTPDETLIYQYSALGFNSHKIHLDREHARNVEGFPDLVVNGGLSTLLLTEFLRLELAVKPRSISLKHQAPLYCNQPILLTADRGGTGWHLKAFNDQYQLAVDMEVNTNEL
jgi:3-methylfumaryl-CoA hydratase